MSSTLSATGMKVIDLVKLVIKCMCLDDIFKAFPPSSSIRGNVYEKLWILAVLSKYNTKRYIHYFGNANKRILGTEDKINIDEFINTPILSKNKGGCSDITMYDKKDGKWIFGSSKYFENDSTKSISDDYDISKIGMVIGKHYKNKKCEIWLYVNSKKCVEELIQRSHSTNDIYTKSVKGIFGYYDLEKEFPKLKNILCLPGKNYRERFGITLKYMSLKMHQNVCVEKTIQRMKSKREMVWGQIPRSGKTYTMAGLIIKLDALTKRTPTTPLTLHCTSILKSGNRKYQACGKTNCKIHKTSFVTNPNNILLITTAPNETFQQYKSVFDCIQLREYKVTAISTNTTKPKSDDKNIIITSKQFLGGKISDLKNVKWLKDMTFSVCFVDESHLGGTTELADNIKKIYAKNAFVINVTATYRKPISAYNISPSECCLWDAEDISLCKKLSPENKKRLIEKHGTKMEEHLSTLVSDDDVKNVESDYTGCPELCILSDEIIPSAIIDINKETKYNHYGYSTNGIFLIEGNSNRFQDEDALRALTYRIFGGPYTKYGVPLNPKMISMMKRIESLRKIHKSSTPKTEKIIFFLPSNNIDKISEALEAFWKANNSVLKYIIVRINTLTSKGDPKERIKEAMDIANKERKDLIILTGRQCSVGVSFEDCDICVMLSNSDGNSDLYIQSMYRCMTERPGKTMGFVIDLIFQRVAEYITREAIKYSPSKTTKDAIDYILRSRIITLNDGDLASKITSGEKVYGVYSSNFEARFKDFSRIRFELPKEEQKKLNALVNSSGKSKVKIVKKDTINEGIERIEISRDVTHTPVPPPGETTPEEKEVENINIMEIVVYMSVFLSILTLENGNEHITTLEGMYDVVTKNTGLLENFNTHMQNVWFKKGSGSINTLFIMSLYSKLMSSNQEVKDIIAQTKEMFAKVASDPRKLSEAIDIHFIPRTNDKKENAEVSTPFGLRKEMLDKVPIEFWAKPQRVFEPCSGKGGFLVDIVERFMEGLKEMYPNEKERKKVIVEKCIYFADINPLNIHINKVLLDSNKEYKLNYHLGDTLKLDVKAKWGIKGFDAVIGNPPYNNSQNHVGKRGGGNSLWDKFTSKSLNEWLNARGYLVFVHPCRWRKPESEHSKNNGLFKLMTLKNQMVFLSMHNVADGLKTFKCGTSYDWYIVEKTPKHKNTIVIDTLYTEKSIDMSKFEWMPNHSVETLKCILAKEGDERCEIIFDPGCDPRKKWMSRILTGEFKYPVVYTTPQKGTRFVYSSRNDKGYFGVPKVIFGDSGINEPVIDFEGEYGMSEHSMGIKISSLEEGKLLSKSLKSEGMKNLINSCMFSTYGIDWRMFKDLRKDFWKEFL
jgi:hypothetical protein